MWEGYGSALLLHPSLLCHPCFPHAPPCLSFSLANLVTLELRENLLKSLPA